MVEFEANSIPIGIFVSKVQKKTTSKSFQKLHSPIIQSIFEFCSDCTLLNIKMSSIPQGLFAANKIRDARNNMTVARTLNNEGYNEPQKHFSTKLMELSPLKYNSKLMNSIWGLYNRYSPHNIKRTNDEYANGGDLQQNVANLPKCAVMKEALDAGNKQPVKTTVQSNVPMLENFWSTMPISH